MQVELERVNKALAQITRRLERVENECKRSAATLDKIKGKNRQENDSLDKATKNPGPQKQTESRQGWCTPQRHLL